MRIFSSYLLLLCAILLGATAHADPPLEHVTLQLKWKHQFQFAGYYAALEKGFYREAGLDVSILPAEPGKPYIDPVLNGHAAFGVASSELAVLRAQGKPVVALAPIYQHSPLLLIVGANSNIDNVHELAGKRIMIAPEEAEVFAYLQAEGLDLKSLQLVPHTYSPKQLIANEVDAISGYSTDEPFDLEMAKFKFSVFKPRSGGIDFYADTLFTTEEQIHDHPDRVKRFVEASLRGWQYAFAHTNEIIDLILEKYAPEKSRAHLVFEAEESRRLIQPDLVELGYSNPGRWKEIAEAYDRLGMMPKEWSIDGLLYDRHPNHIPRWVIGALGASLLGTTIVGMFALYLVRLNAVIKQQALDLREALDAVQTLRGIIPICGYCKKIRDDQGAWKELEHYIAAHSEAEFSHGICTDCYGKLRGELEAGREEKRRKALKTPGV